MENKMEILKKELKLKGFTIKELAAEINVSETAIYLWLSGTYFPKAVHVKKLLSMGFSEAACLQPSRKVEIE